jgi:hypothetical protein
VPGLECGAGDYGLDMTRQSELPTDRVERRVPARAGDAARPELRTASGIDLERTEKASGSLHADIIIANAPDPVFVSDLEGKILQANEDPSYAWYLDSSSPIEAAEYDWSVPYATVDTATILELLPQIRLVPRARMIPYE